MHASECLFLSDVIMASDQSKSIGQSDKISLVAQS